MFIKTTVIGYGLLNIASHLGIAGILSTMQKPMLIIAKIVYCWFPLNIYCLITTSKSNVVTKRPRHVLAMDHGVFPFATRGQCIKGKKLDCFEHNHVFCFKLQCASIVVLLCTAIWWKLKYAVVHSQQSETHISLAKHLWATRCNLDSVYSLDMECVRLWASFISLRLEGV